MTAADLSTLAALTACVFAGIGVVGQFRKNRKMLDCHFSAALGFTAAACIGWLAEGAGQMRPHVWAALAAFFFISWLAYTQRLTWNRN